MGEVINNEFCLQFRGNRHLPLINELNNFDIEMNICGDHFHCVMGLEIFFRYDPRTLEGWCLSYDWGVTEPLCSNSGLTECFPEYECTLLRYYGRRKNNKYEQIATDKRSGHLKDLQKVQSLKIEVSSNTVMLRHDDLQFDQLNIPVGFAEYGLIALDQSHRVEPHFMRHKGAHRILSLHIDSEDDFQEKVIAPEIKIEFPCELNGIISPFYFHIQKKQKGSVPFLRCKLTGGPMKEPMYPDIDRCRFNEKMINPYIRLESASKGSHKHLLVKGEVGLTDYFWNIKTSTLSPAQFECPLQRDIYSESLLDDYRIFIGYEYYLAEDSFCKKGGPAEALVSWDGDILYAGPAFEYDDSHFMVESPIDKAVCQLIPADIPNYDDALIFAQRNHFFTEGETVKFKIRLNTRDTHIQVEHLQVTFILEDVFGTVIKVETADSLYSAGAGIGDLPEARIFGSKFISLGKLPPGVYHLRVNVSGAMLPEQLVVFEVMPAASGAPCAPQLSGLPELHVNILSGINNEHFHPWSHMVCDSSHYNSSGNNYFKVARELGASRLLHVYGRIWKCWLKPWRTIFEERGILPNADLIKEADEVHANVPVPFLCWSASGYAGDRPYPVFLRQALHSFLSGDDFEPVQGGCLYAGSFDPDDLDGISEAQFDELFTYHWNDWISYVTNMRMTEQQRECELVKEINPQCKLFRLGIAWSIYTAQYKSPYFMLQYGLDARAGLERLFPGANGFEDYPYSSGYPIARGIYALAALKLESPKLLLYPEVFGINGETLDHRVVFANPPLGQSDPPYGFLIKQFYEYNFATVWFDQNGFNFWNDHGYQPKTWDMDNYREMLYAYSFISKVKPVKPLQTTAFLYSLDACLAHPDYRDLNEEYFGSGSIVNTAEEAVAFAYEEARQDGQQAGFVMRLEDMALLKSEDVDTLVLPPLIGVSDEDKIVIRKLHERGVSLLGFEDVSGLEDLFGVEATEPVLVNNIAPEPDSCVFNALTGMSEYTEHELCMVSHCLAGAEMILKAENDVPVLTCNKTKWGKAALFTLPPTFVNRAKTVTPSYGQKSNSALINTACRQVLRVLGNKQVTTSSGTLIAFQEQSETTHIILAEDRCPEKGQPIKPLLKLQMPGLSANMISSDKDFDIVRLDKDTAELRFSLDADESAVISIRK